MFMQVLLDLVDLLGHLVFCPRFHSCSLTEEARSEDMTCLFFCLTCKNGGG